MVAFQTFQNILLNWKERIGPLQNTAKKFEGTKYEEEVRLSKSPGDAKKMGGRRDLPFRKDWEEVKEGFMFKALEAKFTQHDDLKKVLLGTGERKLVEFAKFDSYWGIGNGNGKNRLGVLLMQLRDKLKEN